MHKYKDLDVNWDVLGKQSRGAFNILSNLCDEEFLHKNITAKAVNYFCKNAPSSIFDKVLNTSL